MVGFLIKSIWAAVMTPLYVADIPLSIASVGPTRPALAAAAIMPTEMSEREIFMGTNSEKGELRTLLTETSARKRGRDLDY